jgi:Sec-independent protein translocase protein TatA
MITAALFFLFLGLVVFGPRKTIEFTQALGRFAAQAKRASGQLQSEFHEEVRTSNRADGRSAKGPHDDLVASCHKRDSLSIALEGATVLHPRQAQQGARSRAALAAAQ